MRDAREVQGDDGPPQAEELERRYLAEVAELVEELTPGHAMPPGDLEAVRGTIRRTLEDDAAHELREVVSTIRGALEIAVQTSDGSPVTVDRGRVEQMMAALDRAEAVVETHLDPATTLKLLVQVDPEPVVLGRQLARFLTVHGLDPGGERVRSHLSEARVQADREKVVEGLGHLALDLAQRAGPPSQLVVDIRPTPDDGVRGYLALDPPPFEREELVEALDQPLELGTMEIDVPYVRAVLERHGGTLGVAEAPTGGLGYRFDLPASPPEVTP